MGDAQGHDSPKASYYAGLYPLKYIIYLFIDSLKYINLILYIYQPVYISAHMSKYEILNTYLNKPMLVQVQQHMFCEVPLY